MSSLRTLFVLFGVLFLSLVFLGCLGSSGPDASLAGSCKNDSRGEDSCWSILAQQEKNAQYCDQIKETGAVSRNDCYQGVAIAKNDSAMCAALADDNAGVKDICFIRIATNTMNEALCEKVSTQADQFGWNNQNDCYTGVAVAKKDASVCEKIVQPQQKQTCIQSAFV